MIFFLNHILLAWKSDYSKKKLSFSLGTLLGFCFFLLQHSSIFLLGDIIDITVIPTDGKIGRAFATGDFSFEIILLYGMYLIKMIAILAGSLYIIINLYAGLQMIMADWIPGVTKENGKNTIINAFIGFGLTVFSWIIMDFIISFVSE